MDKTALTKSVIIFIIRNKENKMDSYVRHEEYIQNSNGKLHRNRHLARFMWADNITMDVTEIRCVGMGWFTLGQYGKDGDLLRKC
jgi:hypothetical protein